MALNSSYLIDVSKKCIVRAAGTIKSTDVPKGKDGKENPLTEAVGLYWTALGDVSEKSLESAGFKVSEDWIGAEEELTKSFNKAMKPAQMLLSSIVKNIPLLKDFPINNNEDFRTTLMYSWVLLKQFLSGDTSENTPISGAAGSTPGSANTNGATQLADQIETMFQKSYAYFAPLRRGPPKISPVSNNIAIDFAYGKCNIYDAYYEVYLPLKKIMEALKPETTIEGESGLVTYKGRYKVPYPQQAFGELVKQVFSQTASYIDPKESEDKSSDTTSSGDSSKNAGVRLDLFGTVGKLKDLSASLVDSVNLNATKFINNNKPKLQWDGVDKTILKDNLSKGFGDSTSLNPKITRALPSDAEIPTGEANENEVYEDVTGYLQNMLDAFKDAPKGYKINVTTKKTPLKSVVSKEGKFDSTFNYTEVTGTDKENQNDIMGILSSFANFEPSVIGATSKRLTVGLMGNENDIYLGFPAVYCRSVGELANFLKEDTTKESKCVTQPRIVYKNLLIQEYEISMNFKDVDERGYPMSGQFKINKTWNLYVPSESFDINEETGEEDNYIEEVIPYTDS